MTPGHCTLSLLHVILSLCAYTHAQIYLTGDESQDLPLGFWQMDDNLAVAPVIMAQFYQAIGLTANGSVAESMTKLNVAEYPIIISNMTTEAANFTQHILVEQLENNVTAISVRNALNAADEYIETPADLQYKGEYALRRAKFCGIEVRTWAQLLNSHITQWIDWGARGVGGNEKYCGSQEFTNIYLDGQKSWSLFVKTWSTNSNCATTASKKNLACAVRASVSSMHNRGKIAFCVTYIHGDSWRAELRVVANDAWSRYYPWNIHCPSVNTNNIAINHCFDQAQD